MPTPCRLILTAMLGSLLLSGCTRQGAIRPAATTPSSGTSQHEAPATSQSGETGVAACDEYLSSYLACQRAAALYPPEQLPFRYEAMRNSLLRDSQDPAVRPQLAHRCSSLSSQLREALHGKSCADVPAPGGTP